MLRMRIDGGYPFLQMNRLMGKPTICICKKQRRRSAKLISAFVFATRIVQFLFYLNPKFQASSSFLCLNRPVCVIPVRKPHCWFSHEAAQIIQATDPGILPANFDDIIITVSNKSIQFALFSTWCALTSGKHVHEKYTPSYPTFI